MDAYSKYNEAAIFVKDFFQFSEDNSPSTALLTGSGSDGISDHFDIINEVSYADIPHMPVPTFHQGKMVLAKNKSGVPIIMCLGRLHYYEGYSAQEVTFPVRILQLLGIKTLYLSLIHI